MKSLNRMLLTFFRSAGPAHRKIKESKGVKYKEKCEWMSFVR